MRDYITCLITIIRKISPPPSLDQQLDQLHRNLRPRLQAVVRRTEFDSVEGLLELAVDAEQTVENSKTFRPPPPSTAALLPEMAYHPLPKTNTQRKSRDSRDGKMAAASGEKGTKSENLEDMLPGRRRHPGRAEGAVTSRRDVRGEQSPQRPLRGPRQRARLVAVRHLRTMEATLQESRDLH